MKQMEYTAGMSMIAIIEDEKQLANSLQEGLKDEGYEATVFYNAESAEAEIIGEKSIVPDLIILDLMLPVKSGFEFCKIVRENGIATPIIILTALDSVDDKVAALDSGADDYISKPFSFEELLARVRALLRRPAVLHDSPIIIADLKMDPGSRKVFRGETEIILTPKEFNLLRYLMERPGKAISRDELCLNAWKMDDVALGNVVDVHVRHLRQKIDDEYDPKIIRTVRGAGYAVEG